MYFFKAPLTISSTTSLSFCPGNYVEYMDRCLKFVASPLLTRPSASSACSADENGWLATLDSYALASGVVAFFSMDVLSLDVYFGLYKTADCTSTNCISNDLLRWEARSGETPSTAGYTSNMMRYISRLVFGTTVATH